MKKIILIIIALSSINLYSVPRADKYVIELARAISRDVFAKNGVEFMQPVVRMVNASSNSRFSSTAKIPVKDSLYFRFGIQTMFGFVSEDMKTYTPKLETTPFDTNVNKYINYQILPQDPYFKINSMDTAGLIYYIFKNTIDTGLKRGSIKLPKKAYTGLGPNLPNEFNIPRDTLKELIKFHPLYSLLSLSPNSKWMIDTLNSIIGQFPEKFPLYGGSELNPVITAIPQFEIGSFYGTELLFRYIPEFDYGKTIGDFGFWGIGLKHSLSRYFPKSFEENNNYLAAQVVFQGTNLKNSVGVTEAELTANADIFDFNLTYGKIFNNGIELFASASYESLKINSNYKYYLPVTLQWQLGLLENEIPYPTEGYPGDTEPQNTKLEFTDVNYKFILGLSKNIGPLTFAFDASISKIFMLSGGIQYNF